MSGFTQDVERFNKWIGINYQMLQKYCKRYCIEEDYISRAYILTYDRIIRSGFTESYFNTYVKRVIRNLQINDKKTVNGRYEIDFTNEDYTVTIENKLQEQDDTDRDTQLYHEDVMYLSKKLFEYLMTEGRYNEEWNFVFRSYYLMAGRMTYAKLNVMTGIDKVKCCRIIKTIKKDIRMNFLEWLKDEQRRNHRSNE